MLPSLSRLLLRAKNHQSNLPDDILDKIDGIIGSDDPCDGLRQLCELRKDLCSEEVYRAACSHFRYNTEKIRDAFLDSLALEGTNTQKAKSIAHHPWRLCFRQLCARPKLTDADFPGHLYNNFYDENEVLREGVSQADVDTAMQQFQGAVDVAANNQWTHPRYGHISYWDVSQVTDMYAAFRGKKTFNEDIHLWDVSSVTNMSQMFNNAIRFNKPLNDWNILSVTDMTGMFYKATVFNQPLDWDVSNVTEMSWMFSGARAFNNLDQPLKWDVSSVTHMTLMFWNARVFNQPLTNKLGGPWDVSSVTHMRGMFAGAHAFDRPLNWDVSSVTSMFEMFAGARKFNQPLDWDVRNVRDMGFMFHKATAFNQPLDQLFARGHPTPAADKVRMFRGSAQDPLPDWYNPEIWG